MYVNTIDKCSQLHVQLHQWLHTGFVLGSKGVRVYNLNRELFSES